MDQQTNETMAIKAEIYDLQKANQQLQSIVMHVCSALELDVSQGLDLDALVNKLEELKGDEE